MPLSNRQIRSLLLASSETHIEEIDCEGFLSHVAEYAEARAAGRAIPAALAQAQAHERLCANCAEECAALVEMLRAEQDA
jgi:hypothetical protein